MIGRIGLAHLLLTSATLYGGAFRIDEIVFPGAVAVLPESINNAGVVVGSIYTQTEAFGFVYNHGLVQPLGSPSLWLRPMDINNYGDIVGQASTAAFLLRGITGELSFYSKPGCLFTTFWGTNDTGSIVGDCFTSSGPTTAFLFEGGVFDDSLQPIVQMGPVRDINNSNQVVGLFGFGQLGASTIKLPGGYGVNNLGQISTTAGVLTSDGLNPLLIPGVAQIDIRKLNDRGQVVGSYFDGADFHGFIATPVPEPRCVVSGIALTLLLAARRRFQASHDL